MRCWQNATLSVLLQCLCYLCCEYVWFFPHVWMNVHSHRLQLNNIRFIVFHPIFMQKAVLLTVYVSVGPSKEPKGCSFCSSFQASLLHLLNDVRCSCTVLGVAGNFWIWHQPHPAVFPCIMEDLCFTSCNFAHHHMIQAIPLPVAWTIVAEETKAAVAGWSFQHPMTFAIHAAHYFGYSWAVLCAHVFLHYSTAGLGHSINMQLNWLACLLREC